MPKTDHEPRSKISPCNDHGVMKTSSSEGNAIEDTEFGFVEFLIVADPKHALKKANGNTVWGRLVAADIAVEQILYNIKTKHSGDNGSKPSHRKLRKSRDK